MNTENIFSALSKYSSSQDENYLTESFVFVLNELLRRERQICLDILTKLCIKDNEFSFDIDEDVLVTTQEVTDVGIPDIKILTPDKLIYIEVKDSATVHRNQISQYKKALELSTANFKHVVLLTRFAVDFKEQEERPYKHIRWYEVYNWLANAKAQDLVSIYLIESFKSFLEDKHMSIEKVGWEYINGVPSFNNLINMIDVAIKGASLHVHQKSAGWASKAFWLEKKRYWCGVYYSAPLVVIFKAIHKEGLNPELLSTPTYPIKEAHSSYWFQLKLEDIHFFALDKDRQLEELNKFVRTAYAEAQQMRIQEV